MRIHCRSRALGALCALLLLLLLSACGRPGPDPAATEAPSPGPELTDGSQNYRWQLRYDASGELLRRLGYDPGLSGELPAVLSFTLAPDGRCVFTADYSACEEPLRLALLDYLRSVRSEEAGTALSGAALAEALGADPNEAVAAIIDELLPAAAPLRGRLSDAGDAVLWDDGSRSAICAENGGVRITLPLLGERLLAPAD